MKKFLKKARAVALAFLIVLLATPIDLAKTVLAASDTNIINPDSVTLEDGVVLSKTAEPVAGFLNKYEVTLKIESPKSEKTSDTVLVIDRSGSMGQDDKLSKVKTAAKSLAKELLEGNETNRVAVISFATETVTELEFSNNYTAVARAIDRLRADGGTFTQRAIRIAARLINNSDADIKNIILLSDGEPTYSYGFVNTALVDEGNFVDYNDALQTSPDVVSTVFNTRRVGNGKNLRICTGSVILGRCTTGKYYNHGNSAIAEATYYKNNSDGGLYTVALDAGESGAAILQAMASPGKNYEATAGDLKTIFDEIGGRILALAEDARAEDAMGDGLVVSNTGAGSLETWYPEFKLVGDKFVATKTYEVEFTEDVLNATPSTEHAGFYALNSEATIEYNGKKVEFPVPYARPVLVKVTKSLVDETGKTSADATFGMKLAGPADFAQTKYIKAGETATFVSAFPVGDYTVREVATANNAVRLENYLVQYEGADFTLAQNQTTDVLAGVVNRYEETEVAAAKVWQDDNDRDGKRVKQDLYLTVKDGEQYVAYEKIGAVDKTVTFNGLPKNKAGQEIDYKVAEAKSCKGVGAAISCKAFTGNQEYTVSYMVDNGVATVINTHQPELYHGDGKLTVKKLWQNTGTLMNLPASVTVELLANGEVIKTVDVFAGQSNDWVHTFTGLYKYEKGQEIVYSVREKAVFGADGSSFVVYGPEMVGAQKAVEGKWSSSVNGLEVTNVWEPAKSVYGGETEFYIKKIDAEGKALAGVKFGVNDQEYVTDQNGKIVVKVPAANEVREDDLTFGISEIATLPDYDLVEGSAQIQVTSTSNLVAVDEDKLENIYAKTYSFAKSGKKEFVWNEAERTLVVTNNRSVAKSLTIRKEITGVGATALKKNGLKFVISGPSDFGEQEVAFSEFTKIENGVYEYTVQGKIPTGSYKVSEQGAEFEGLLTLTVAGDINQSKEIKSGDEAVFVIKNQYERIRDVDFAVAKIWRDRNDWDGKRPAELEVTLLRNGQAYKTAVLSEENDWMYEWTGLARAGADAKEYTYTVVEETVEGYESDGGKLMSGVYVFTNTHVVESIDPCASGEGCGGGQIPSLVTTPDTGALMQRKGTEGASVNHVVGGLMVVLWGLLGLAAGLLRGKVGKKA